MQERAESVSTPDGSFDLTVWVPDRGSGPGVLLIEEIFGISDYIRAVAEDLAAAGYVVGAPDLFWRLSPGWAAGHTEQGLAESLALASHFDAAAGVADTVAAFRALTALPGVAGGAGIIGFCFGGTFAYLAAPQAQPGVVISFYGSGVPDQTGLLAGITCPIQFHFAGSDPYIPREQVRKVEQAAAGRPNVEIHVEEEAGHAFHNRKAPMFYQPEPAARAWQRAVGFLREHLPVPQPA
jgi:carboxymethylenebutenolidase